MNNIFDVLKNITNIKNESDLGTDLYNSYMINRFLSMDSNYLIYSNIMNRYYDLPKEIQEYFLYLTIPKRYVFLKYIKDNKKYKEEVINEIQEKYNLSNKKVEEILDFLNKLNNIKNGM